MISGAGCLPERCRRPGNAHRPPGRPAGAPVVASCEQVAPFSVCIRAARAWRNARERSRRGMNFCTSSRTGPDGPERPLPARSHSALGRSVLAASAGAHTKAPPRRRHTHRPRNGALSPGLRHRPRAPTQTSRLTIRWGPPARPARHHERAARSRTPQGRLRCRTRSSKLDP
jgi:hypothetical protein